MQQVKSSVVTIPMVIDHFKEERINLFPVLSEEEILQRRQYNMHLITTDSDNISILDIIKHTVERLSPNPNYITIDLRYYRTISLLNK
jgi:hypothetical protein